MRHCVIFGGCRGIGASVYNLLAEGNYNITVVARTMESVKNFFTSDALNGVDLGVQSGCHRKAKQRPLMLPCDITNEQSVSNTLEVAHKWFGPPTILVNAAGINKDNLLLKTKLADIHKILDTNLIGTMITSKAVLRGMMQQKDGCIVNIGSVVGTRGNSGQCAYSASKAGLVGFTKSLAKEVGSRGIRVNLVTPGFIETDMTQNVSHEYTEAIPINRFGKPEEVAETVKFIIESQYITGQVIHVDGGLHLSM